MEKDKLILSILSYVVVIVLGTGIYLYYASVKPQVIATRQAEFREFANTAAKTALPVYEASKEIGEHVQQIIMCEGGYLCYCFTLSRLRFVDIEYNGYVILAIPSVGNQEPEPNDEFGEEEPIDIPPASEKPEIFVSLSDSKMSFKDVHINKISTAEIEPGRLRELESCPIGVIWSLPR